MKNLLIFFFQFLATALFGFGVFASFGFSQSAGVIASYPLISVFLGGTGILLTSLFIKSVYWKVLIRLVSQGFTYTLLCFSGVGYSNPETWWFTESQTVYFSLVCLGMCYLFYKIMNLKALQ